VYNIYAMPGLLGLLFQSPIVFFLVIAALVISISIHEFSHAFVTTSLGDPTPKYQGRVTLNPKSHIDPLGLIFLVIGGFGWGRPVMFNELNLKNPKRDRALIAFAGPLSNFIVAVVFSLLLKILGLGGILGTFLYLVIIYNLLLGIFNLIPIHPLDGFKVVSGLLPNNLAYQWEQTRKWGIYILLFLILTGTVGNVVGPFLDFATNLLGLTL